MVSLMEKWGMAGEDQAAQEAGFRVCAALLPEQWAPERLRGGKGRPADGYMKYSLIRHFDAQKVPASFEVRRVLFRL